MLTKTQYAKSIVSDFCNTELDGKNSSEVTDWGKYIFMSSSLAVALEFLGLLTEGQKEYSSTRGGTVALYAEYNEEKRTTDVGILSVRELLDLLPD